MNVVIIIGSINLDIILRVKEMLKLGEIIYVIEYFIVGGGKGVN